MRNNGIKNIKISNLFLLVTLFFSWLFLLNSLDDTDSDGLLHVSNGESSEWWVLREDFNAKWLGWSKGDHASITGLDELWCFFEFFTGSSVDLALDVFELAGNVSGVAIEDWSVTRGDLTWMVQNDDLSEEGGGFSWRVVLGITSNVTSSDILDGDVLDVESDVVTWNSLWEGFVMHFDGLDFSGDVDWSEGDHHTWLEDTGFDSADWDCADTTDLVDVLKWDSEWLFSWSLWWDNLVKGFNEAWARVP